MVYANKKYATVAVASAAVILVGCSKDDHDDNCQTYGTGNFGDGLRHCTECKQGYSLSITCINDDPCDVKCVADDSSGSITAGNLPDINIPDFNPCPDQTDKTKAAQLYSAM